MALIDELMKGDKKGLFNSNHVFTNYSTGFFPLDYINGFWHSYMDANGIMQKVPITGLLGGRFVTIFGTSNTGKTTLGDQIGWNIVSEQVIDLTTGQFRDKYPNGLFSHVDIEKTAIWQRLLDVTGATDGDLRLHLQNSNTSIEDVMEMIERICKVKEDMGDACKVEIDGTIFGSPTPIKVYEPTVIMLDSLPSFVSKNTKFTELEGGFAAGRDVAAISQFYMKMLDNMYRYNIMIIAINHIKTDPNASNIYQKPLTQLMLLRSGETLPRGQAPLFYATSIFRLNQCSKSNMYTIEEHGFRGFKAILQVAKSKTAFIGGEIPLAFNADIGYDPIYSLLEWADSMELVGGRNPYLYIKGAEAQKFSRKTFREKFIHDDIFNAQILDALKPTLEALVGSVNTSTADKAEQISLNKLFAVDDKGNLVPTGIVETANGLELVNDEYEEKIIDSSGDTIKVVKRNKKAA